MHLYFEERYDKYGYFLNREKSDICCDEWDKDGQDKEGFVWGLNQNGLLLISMHCDAMINPKYCPYCGSKVQYEVHDLYNNNNDGTLI